MKRDLLLVCGRLVRVGSVGRGVDEVFGVVAFGLIGPTRFSSAWLPLGRRSLGVEEAKLGVRSFFGV